MHKRTRIRIDRSTVDGTVYGYTFQSRPMTCPTWWRYRRTLGTGRTVAR